MPTRFPSFNILFAAAEEGGHGSSFWGLFIYLGLVLGIVVFALHLAKKSFGERVFKTMSSQLVEQVYLFIENLCVSTIGAHGRKYIPMIMTFWLVIFVGNLVALFMATSVTADLSFNLAMALIAICYVQYEGIKANGAIGHLSHFAGPKLVDWSSPKTYAFFLITMLLFGIEIVSELMKNVSLSLRLFGNIDGGHQAVETLNGLTSAYLVPLGTFLMPIKLLTVVVQALIFCLLTCVYLGMVTSHAHEERAH